MNRKPANPLHEARQTRAWLLVISKHRLMRNIAAVILLVLLLGKSAYGGDKQAVPDFSCYPQVRGFLSCVGLHTNAVWNLQHTNLLVVSEFYRMDCVGCDVLQYFVSEGGQVLDYHDNGDGTTNEVRRTQLSIADLKKLRLALSELPVTNQYPWLSTLVIVSHRDGTNWITHSYARSSNEIKESPVLRRIFNIIGERPEAQSNYPF
jgi:hypothetical protein